MLGFIDFSCDCVAYRVNTIRLSNANLSCQNSSVLSLPYYTTALTLSNNPSLNTALSTVFNYPFLSSIFMSNTNITGNLPDTLGQSPATATFTTLDFSSNGITGNIPSFWSRYATITSLKLINNKMTGVVDPCKYIHNMSHTEKKKRLKEQSKRNPSLLDFFHHHYY